MWFIFVEGIASQLLGPLLPTLLAEFDVSASLGGLAGTVNTTGFIVAVLVTGAVFAVVSRKQGAVLGLGTTVLGLGVVVVAPVYVAYLAGLGMRAIGTGVFRGFDRPILSHLYPERRERVLNAYELVWAVGAASAPLVAGAALWYGTWRAAYGLVFVLSLPLLAVAAFAPLPEATVNEERLSVVAAGRLLRRPVIALSTVALLLGGAIEGALFVWLPTYFGAFVGETIAALAFSAFFLAYIPSRLFHTTYVDRLGELPILLTSGVGTVLLLGTSLMAEEAVVVVGAATAVGLTASAFFPLLSTYLIDTVPEQSGLLNAVSLAATFVGGAVASAVVGVTVDRLSVTAGVGLLWVVSVLLSVTFVGLYLRREADP
jgi:fucose permease